MALTVGSIGVIITNGSGDLMPSVSQSQQRLMGAALARKRAGHPAAGDPKMSASQLRDFASTKTRNLPAHKHKPPVSKAPYGKAFV